MKHEDERIELFVFPDGSRVEIIVFEPASLRRGSAAPSAPALFGPPERRSATPAPGCTPAPLEDPDAHRCPVCGSELVYPVEWDRTGDAAWTLVLRCPECETRREVTLGRASVGRLNREIYRGAQAIARAADLATRRNFKDEADWIVAALERDLILPMDF